MLRWSFSGSVCEIFFWNNNGINKSLPFYLISDHYQKIYRFPLYDSDKKTVHYLNNLNK